MPEPIAAAELPRLIADRVAGLGRAGWVGVDGFGASGKSTLAEAIVAAVPNAVMVSIDDFARPGLRGWDRGLFVRRIVEPVLAGRGTTYETWDLVGDAPRGLVRVPAGVPLIVVEGVSSTDVRVPVPWDATVWVDAPADLRWQRILDRDPPELIAIWRDDWLPSERAYADTQRPWERVDYIVTADRSTHPQG